MNIYSKLKGIKQSLFKIGKRKFTIDASNLTVARTVTLPDGDVNLNSGAVGDVLTKTSSTSSSFQASSATPTFDANLVNGRIVPLYSYSGSLSPNSQFTNSSANKGIAKFSPDGRFVAGGTTTNGVLSFIEMFKDRSEITASPPTIPAATLNDCCWSPSGEFLVIGFSNGNVKPWKLDNSTYTALTTFTPSNMSSVSAVHFNADESHLAISGTVALSGGVCRIYIRTLGTNFSAGAALPSIPATGVSLDCKFSVSGEFLAVGATLSPFIYIYQRNTTVSYNKLTNPATIPAATVNTCAWSPDNTYLFVATTSSGANAFLVYKRNGTTFTALTNPAVGFMPTGAVTTSVFAPNGQHFAVGFGSNISIYSLINDVITLVQTFSPVATVLGLAYSPSNRFLMAVTSSGTFFYETNTSEPTVLNKTPKIINKIGEYADFN